MNRAHAQPRSLLHPALWVLVLGAALATQARAGAPDFDGPAIVKAADWKAMKTVTINIEEHSYTPAELVLKAGQPYRIQLRNAGEKDHYYTAPEFFKAVASRKVQVNGVAEIKAERFTALEVLKNGGQLDYYLVPMVKGTYKVHCTNDDHEEKGMHGSITVE